MEPLNPWYGNAAFLVGLALSIAIRAPHETRSKTVAVAESRKGALEAALLGLVLLGHFLLPLLYMTTGLLSFADRDLTPVSLGAGVAVFALALWLFHRSHADLGRNWSVSLEVREGHSLVVSGVYRRIRHPMYAAIFLTSFAQLLLLPNRVAGAGCLVAFGLMFALRLGPEERLMSERFGEEYRAYARRTKRLVPGVW